jgi:hypothetical protein
MSQFRKAAVAFALVAIPAIAGASDAVPSSSLRAGTSREVCANEKLVLDGTKSRFALCVESAMFQHDRYTLKIDGRSIAAGIDDETTQGVTGKSGDRALKLLCTPVHEKQGEPSPGLVEAFVGKGMSEEDARKAAELTTTVETARDCAVSVNDTVRWNVRVQF